MPFPAFLTGDVAQSNGDQYGDRDPHPDADPHDLLVNTTVAFPIIMGAVNPNFASDSSSHRHFSVVSLVGQKPQSFQCQFS